MKRLDYKSWNVKKIVKEIAIMGLIVLVISNVLSYLRKPELNDAGMPQINAMQINGERFRAEDYTGKPLLVHFWATWCPACKAEADNIQRISRYYDVVTIAVKSGSDAEIKRYMEDRGFDYRVINDERGSWAGRYGVAGFPTTFIYNSKGEIAFSEVGYTSTIGLWLRLWWAGV